MVTFTFLLNFWWIVCRFQKFTCFLYLTNSLISCLLQFNPHKTHFVLTLATDQVLTPVPYRLIASYLVDALKLEFALELHGGLVKPEVAEPMSDSVCAVSRIMPPNDVHILAPITYS